MAEDRERQWRKSVFAGADPLCYKSFSQRVMANRVFDVKSIVLGAI